MIIFKAFTKFLVINNTALCIFPKSTIIYGDLFFPNHFPEDHHAAEAFVDSTEHDCYLYDADAHVIFTDFIWDCTGSRDSYA